MTSTKTSRRTRYRVAISKYYFPRETWGENVLPFSTFWEAWDVLADDRTEAAEQVWAEHGPYLLGRMLPDRKRVSLDVDDPKAGVGGRLGRLSPITVYKESEE